ncbi:DNA repair protein RecN [Ramlibacter tataouinensis]|uniref:DNA repair protein RecN n=1 Tax=Ramlibacter tataouinensis (strain ATCC BAA-407 / DSM 14655 / LMG 21543 / TTB310) TaxID=365046 RepID=F5XYR6_RAMTT|nr:DNA repair protein RecN [Ramlibacter tataouinensis]AEG94433.1 Candidate DNA repair ATPase [Ramlibacter tataouinensis TTB310]
MSLKRMALRDFVIVRELELDLSGGFSVLTGETGAGKSILVDALQLALGARADAGVVREGAARADISAEFDLPAQLRPWLEEAGFEHEDSLLLRRNIDAQGKSRAWINGAPATAGQLRELGEQLVDIHGQHAWQSLTRSEAVRGLLDAYAGVNVQPLQQLWQRWRAAQKALADARAAQDSLQRERERLAWQIGEVDKLAPGADEWDELNASHTRLAHAQSLLDAAQQALDALEGDEGGAAAQLAKAHATLQDQEHLEPEYRALAEVLASSLAQAEDAAHSLHAYLRKTELDPQRLAELDERMSLWLSLARRYKRTPAELPALLASWREELAQLDAAADLAALEAAEKKESDAYMAAARSLSKARAKAAPQLAQAITQAMQGLGMQGGRFEVALEKTEQPTQAGLEDVGFLVAGHAGSSPRPVGKVASGGELSRIALAIAVTTSQLGSAQTLIFDEVDAGVGGAVAETVGRLMKQLGRDRQVLAVTHLPQVAACADHHLVVAKQADAGGTWSTVSPVQGEQRVGEIARMLGGERLSGTTLAHAKEMLGQGARPGARARS